MKRLIIKNLLFGFFTWLIPFAVSFLFYKSGGELVISYDLFKSIMIVVASTGGCYFLYRYFMLANNDFIRNGVITGLSWFAINIILDVIILIPIMKVTFADYFMSIGLRYIVIPVISITMGCLLHKKVRQ